MGYLVFNTCTYYDTTIFIGTTGTGTTFPPPTSSITVLLWALLEGDGASPTG